MACDTIEMFLNGYHSAAMGTIGMRRSQNGNTWASRTRMHGTRLVVEEKAEERRKDES